MLCLTSSSEGFMYHMTVCICNTEVMWPLAVLRKPEIKNWAVPRVFETETETLTSNNIIHLLQGGLQHVAGR